MAPERVSTPCRQPPATRGIFSPDALAACHGWGFLFTLGGRFAEQAGFPRPQARHPPTTSAMKPNSREGRGAEPSSVDRVDSHPEGAAFYQQETLVDFRTDSPDGSTPIPAASPDTGSSPSSSSHPEPTLLSNPTPLSVSRRLPRSVVLFSTLFVLLPLMLWLAVLAVPPRSSGQDPMAEWVAAAVQPNAPAVLLGWSGLDGSGAPVALARQDGTLRAFRPGSPQQDLWRFPSEGEAVFLGKTLDDTVFWVPRAGGSASASPSDRSAVLVFQSLSNSDGEEALRTSMLNARGETLWTRRLEAPSGPDRVLWMTSPGPRLGFLRGGGGVLIVHPETGELLDASP